ncbi:hypothetical protein [Bradyrhizobium sp. JYMT SZCCT0428]|uniref:hypothetical protein n=1 Tax=Bradyrhizobium sp. JYMT SZCCT0428 TaxID=2807673 RepID=UPI001BAB7183|nr:hypothetical protein [Bradyrhizobium sp. JYMT SZCCT0428]MBR1150090.1 hypothetical protein [Bradyrhizobium sp. JYMT SZCCT0428]
MRSDIISVVGGGWSVSQVDRERIPGRIIAINDSAIHLPRFDIVVSMDRLWTEYRYDDLHRMQKPAHIRRSALQKLPHKWPWLRSFECDHTSAEFSDQPGVLNGTNSGLCAFNLAYQMRPEKVLLFGLDMKRGANGEVYWYPPYPWSEKGATKNGKYAEWSKQFAQAARQCAAVGIDVAVVGDSAIECFRKVPSSDFARIAA